MRIDAHRKKKGTWPTLIESICPTLLSMFQCTKAPALDYTHSLAVWVKGDLLAGGRDATHTHVSLYLHHLLILLIDNSYFSSISSFGEALNQSRGERIVFWRPNTNTNNIRKFFFTEYEYEYYSSKNFYRIRIRILFVKNFPPNTNTNIIRSENITEYEYE